MSVPSYGEIPRQLSSGKVHPTKEGSQFKAPLRFQSGKPLEQGQRSSTQGSSSSRGGSQFKAPLRFQSNTLREQDQPYSASGVPSFKSAPLYHVTNPSQPIVLQHSGPTMSLPRAQALPSIGDPITLKSSIVPIYSDTLSADPYSGISTPLSSLEAQRRRSPQLLSASDQSWQAALPQAEPLVRSKVVRRTKTYILIKVILMGGTALLVGGIASFLLLRFPTYLVVTWAILIIVFSNLVSRELRSYYQLPPTTPRMDSGHPSSISTSHDMDMGRHPELKDIRDTTGYLKALCLVIQPDHPVQIFPAEKEYKV